MNEFIKEELVLLRACLTKQLHEVHYPLEDKLTLMIENYCDHDQSEANHDYEVEQCKKCGKLFV